MANGPDADARLVRFLLGLATEAEREHIERRCLDEREPTFAALVAREDELRFDYLEGRLSAADRVRFEQRYLMSAAERSRLAFARALLRRAARAILGCIAALF